MNLFFIIVTEKRIAIEVYFVDQNVNMLPILIIERSTMDEVKLLFIQNQFIKYFEGNQERVEDFVNSLDSNQISILYKILKNNLCLKQKGKDDE